MTDSLAGCHLCCPGVLLLSLLLVLVDPLLCPLPLSAVGPTSIVQSPPPQCSVRPYCLSHNASASSLFLNVPVTVLFAYLNRWFAFSGITELVNNVLQPQEKSKNDKEPEPDA